jgi:hypothetical protein
MSGLRDLAVRGPVLLCIPPKTWPEVRRLSLYHPVAANTCNLFVGNDAFFRVAGVQPLPDDAIKPQPMLLLPRPAATPPGTPEATP